MNLTLEEKLECVKLHLDEGIPIYELARIKGIDPARLKYCLGLYEKCGEKALKMSPIIDFRFSTILWGD